MSFSAAVIVVLAAAAIFLGLVAHNIVSRLEELEAAVGGGMTPPERPLGREEFIRRWRTALARADFAASTDPGMYLFLDLSLDSAQPFLDAIAALPSGHDLTVVSPNDRRSSPLEGPGVSFRNDDGLIKQLEIAALPYIIAVEDGRITSAAPVGNAARVLDALREGAA